ncbi:MAG: hypothetical protein K0R68_3738 [Mycobacterium sp.]|nr:hypothetical protein [Mycobacterium sp.]
MTDDSADIAQARVLLAALRDEITRISRLLEKAETGRRAGASPTAGEKSLRRDLYEAHRHADKLVARFPEARLLERG